jgi:NADH-quinone oxidoreductase subunit H
MKIAAHIQVRLGPMRVGRFHGVLQTIADGIKLLLKEDLVPAGADRWVHFVAPVVAVAPALVCFAPIPLGHAGLAPVGLDVGLLFVLGVSGLSVIGLLMAGWGSNNKYSMLGGLRAAAQVVSYEIPRVISLLPVVMWAGSMQLGEIMMKQSGTWAGVLPKWFIFYPIVGQISFIIYLISSIAETNRTPFDIAEAESELTSGFHTEYSGMKWAMFFMAEYAYMFLACALGAVLFLGGGNPLVSASLDFIPSYVWFFGKTFFLAFLFHFDSVDLSSFEGGSADGVLLEISSSLVLGQRGCGWISVPDEDALMFAYFKLVFNGARGLVTGLGVTLRHLFMPSITVQYPHEKLTLSDRFRGALAFHPEICISCEMCVRACPSACISLESKRNEETKKKDLSWYKIDFGKCNYCRLCEEVCPTKPKSVHHTKEYELSLPTETIL